MGHGGWGGVGGLVIRRWGFVNPKELGDQDKFASDGIY